MSLKAFHVVFVSLAILLSLGFGIWGVRSFQHTGDAGDLWMGIGSLAAAMVLAVYFRWFLRKLKNESYL